MHPKSAMRDKEGQRDHCDHVQPTWAFGEHWSTKWAQKVVQSTSNMCGVELSWKSTTWIHIVCQRVWYIIPCSLPENIEWKNRDCFHDCLEVSFTSSHWSWNAGFLCAVKFVSKVCKRLTRWTNYTFLGSSFFGGQDLNQGERLPKKVDPFSEVSLEEIYGLPELPTCLQIQVLNMFELKRVPPIFSIRKRGTRFFFRNLWNLPVSTKKRNGMKKGPPIFKKWDSFSRVSFLL